MTQALRLLIIEDVEDDALRLVRELLDAGFNPDFVRVETPHGLEVALEGGSWDAVISDYSMPSFKGLDALRTIRARHMDIPFIMVSGVVSDEHAIEAMKAGAHDFIQKQSLVRVAPALERELRVAAARREHRHLEKQLTWYQEHLEECVQERTEELKKANKALQAEMSERKKAEDALCFIKGRYRALFRENPTMIAILDADLTVLSVNPTCAYQLGYAIEELEGRSALVLFHEEDRLAVAEQLFMCLQNPDQAFHWQFRKIRKDGCLLWVEETAQAVYDANGMLNVLIVCQDVSERRRMEEELRESEERFRVTFSQAPIGIGHVTPDGRWQRINQKYCEIVGYTEEEFKALTIEEITHPDDLETSRQHFRYLLKGKLERYSLEKRYIRKDGSSVWVNLTASLVFDTAGNPKFVVGIVEDITSRKQAEEALRKSEMRFRRLFESAKDGIMILDANTGQIVNANLSLLALLGYSHEELMGMLLWEIGAFADIAGSKDCFTKLQQEESFSYEDLPLLTKDGRRLYVEFVSNVYQVDGMKVIQCNIRDISYRKFAEQEINKLNNDLAARAAELESANLELEAFNYTVAHDLRTPLNIVGCYCQVLKELYCDKLDEEGRHYIDETYNGTLRMNRLIEALLNFSRLAHAELNLEMIDLSRLAHDVARELGVTEAERRVMFRIGDGIVGHGDANLLRVVLANLLGNAWKYTAIRGEGIIEFGIKEIDGRPVFFVSDNGAGFDSADAEKIFTPFKRLPDADKCRVISDN